MSTPKLKVVSSAPDSVVQNQVSKWTPEVLACRSMQHQWSQVDARYSQRYHYYAVRFLCTRCGTTRHQELNSRGQITSNSYTYPEGYLSGAGIMDADARGWIRIANLNSHDLETVKNGEKPKGKRTSA